MNSTAAYKAMLGLRKKETYEALINYLLTDQEVIRYPDRYAKQLRESPYLTQLDGEGLGQMQDQQERQFREQHRENTIRQVASTSNQSVSQVKADIAHRETFSQTEAATPDVKMGATTDTQTDDPVMVNSGTGTDNDPPPPGAGAIRTDRGTSPLPPPHHYVHMNVDHHPPPPPPPEAPRIRKSTTDASTQDDIVAQTGGQPPPPQPPSEYGKIRTKRGTPYEAQASSSSSGNPPGPPPPAQEYYIGDTPMGSHENRALSVEMRQAAEAQKLYESKQEKRAKNKAAFRQYLEEVNMHPMKRAADEASNTVAEQALELAHAAAKARRNKELQAKQDKLSMQEELKRQTALQRAELEAAKRELSANHRARVASHHKRVAAEKAELEGQRQQIEAQRKTLEVKKKAVGRPKRQAAPTRTQSAETVYYPPGRSESVDTVNYGASRSRSRAKSAAPALPIKGEEQSVEPVKRPRGRPRKEKEAVEAVKKPRGRPRTKA